VKQVVSFKHIQVDDWKGTVKQVYEVTYAITIKIYDETANDYKDGCSVKSTASAATRRNNGVNVEYKATVAPAQKESATAAATEVANNPSAMIASVSKAKAAVIAKASPAEKAAINNMVVPTVAQIQVEKATITTPAPPPPPKGKSPAASPTSNASSSGGDMTMFIIIGAVGVAVVILVIVVAFIMCRKDDEEEQQMNKKGKVDKGAISVEVNQIGVKPTETKE
jgi:hypothetical protein